VPSTSNPAVNGDLILSPDVAGPLARPTQLPRGTGLGLSAPSPTGNLANLFPVVTPAPTTSAAPAAPSAGKAGYGPAGASAGVATALTADSGALATRQGRLIALLLTIAAGIAAFGLWFAASGPARRMVGSLARRRSHHTR
jgi:hypothetical protein